MPDDAVLERTVAFDPASLSAREARRFVRDVLHGSGREAWAERAELAVSEVVTNVVLHAHTSFDLTVRLHSDHVRVEVRDGSAAVPRQRDYDDEATTGRGMALVGAVTDAHGVSLLGAAGKVVWFCVGDGPADDDADPLAGWDDTGWETDGDQPAAAPAPADLARVVLPGMPPVLWFAARQHHDALLRELALHRAAHPGLAIRDVDLAQADAARTAVSTALEATLARDALAAADPVTGAVDLQLDVPRDAGGSFARLRDVLDAAEALAAEDVLLMTPGLPEVVAVRHWACEQVQAQLAGAAPVRWVGADDERFTTAPGPATEPPADVGDLREVAGAVDGVVSADEANRITAVSRPLADLLGWPVDELVGRRVVTVVPPRYREAHVAGFTRHLATGQARVLGTVLQLPVLRRDGSEVLCTLRIESRDRGGRRGYVAWISPAR